MCLQRQWGECFHIFNTWLSSLGLYVTALVEALNEYPQFPLFPRTLKLFSHPWLADLFAAIALLGLPCQSAAAKSSRQPLTLELRAMPFQLTDAYLQDAVTWWKWVNLRKKCTRWSILKECWCHLNSEGKGGLFTKWHSHSKWLAIKKKAKVGPYTSPYIKANSRWIKDFRIKNKTGSFIIRRFKRLSLELGR